MELYKESLLNKIEDDLTGRNQNWDEIEAHLADYEAHLADYEAHLADYEAHLAEDAQKHITESGENTNGRYIKFDNGTMICTILTSVTTDSTKAYVAFDVVFPVSFLNTDYAISHAWYGGAPGRSGAFTKHAGTRATGSVSDVTYTSLDGTNFASISRTVSTMVIGRWK